MDNKYRIYTKYHVLIKHWYREKKLKKKNGLRVLWSYLGGSCENYAT